MKPYNCVINVGRYSSRSGSPAVCVPSDQVHSARAPYEHNNLHQQLMAARHSSGGASWGATTMNTITILFWSVTIVRFRHEQDHVWPNRHRVAVSLSVVDNCKKTSVDLVVNGFRTLRSDRRFSWHLFDDRHVKRRYLARSASARWQNDRDPVPDRQILPGYCGARWQSPTTNWNRCIKLSAGV